MEAGQNSRVTLILLYTLTIPPLLDLLVDQIVPPIKKRCCLIETLKQGILKLSSANDAFLSAFFWGHRREIAEHGPSKCISRLLAKSIKR